MILIFFQCFPFRGSFQSLASDWWILQEYSALNHKLLLGPHLSASELPRVHWTLKIPTSASFSSRWVHRQGTDWGTVIVIVVVQRLLPSFRGEHRSANSSPYQGVDRLLLWLMSAELTKSVCQWRLLCLWSVVILTLSSCSVQIQVIILYVYDYIITNEVPVWYSKPVRISHGQHLESLRNPI